MKTRDGRGKKVKKSTEPKVIIGMSYGGPEHTRRTLRELFLGRESHSLSVVGRQLVACGGYQLVLVLVLVSTSTKYYNQNDLPTSTSQSPFRRSLLSHQVGSSQYQYELVAHQIIFVVALCGFQLVLDQYYQYQLVAHQMIFVIALGGFYTKTSCISWSHGQESWIDFHTMR